MKRYCVATDSLFNLSGPGKPLKAEPPDTAETAGLLRTGRARLMDAGNAVHKLGSDQNLRKLRSNQNL